MSLTEVEETAPVSSVRRAAHLLSTLARKGPLGVRSLSRELGLPVATTQRILNDLALEAMAEQQDGEWVLGHRAIALGRIHIDRLDLVRIAKPYCKRIAEDVGESVNVVVRSGFLAMCIDKTSGERGAFLLDWPVGVPGPLHCGGSGKAILAFSGPSAQEAVLSRTLTPLTQFTIVDPAVLREEIRGIRARGYAIDAQEVALGVWCVGVPILDADGVAIAALSISGPSRKEVAAQIEPLVRQLSVACHKISRQFGFSGPWPAGTSA